LIRDLRSAGKDDRKIEVDNCAEKEIQTLMATVREQSAQIQKVSARLAAASLSSGGLEAGNAVVQTAFNDR